MKQLLSLVLAVSMALLLPVSALAAVPVQEPARTGVAVAEIGISPALAYGDKTVTTRDKMNLGINANVWYAKSTVATFDFSSLPDNAVVTSNTFTTGVKGYPAKGVWQAYFEGTNASSSLYGYRNITKAVMKIEYKY